LLIISGLAAGRYRYYTDAVGSPGQLADGRGERAGRWIGAGPGKLGLAGDVAAEDLARALLGQDPDGVPLVRVCSNRRAGLDLMFAAPKPVSLMLALGAPAVVRAVEECHDAGVAAAVEYLEREACVVRRSDLRLPGQGLVAAAFRHVVSRADDPHLHSHVVVANLVAGPDGSWSALHTPLLFAERHTADAVYQAVLRHELTRRLGVGWELGGDGGWELAGVPPAVTAEFSRRRAQILRLIDERASSGQGRVAGDWSAALTRPARADLVDRPRLEREWRQRADQLGFAPPRLWLDGPDLAADVRPAVYPGSGNGPEFFTAPPQAAADGGVAAQPPPAMGQVLADINLGRDWFTRSELLRAWCRVAPTSASLADIEGWVGQTLRSAEIVGPLQPARAGGPGRFDGPSGPPARYSTAQVERAASLLTRAMIGDEPDLTTVVVPGGQTTGDVVGAIRSQSAATVVAAAPTTATARMLEGESGVTAVAVSSLADQLERDPSRWRSALGPRPVVVVTGVDRLPTSTITRVVASARSIGARVVLVGEVGRGTASTFSRLASAGSAGRGGVDMVETAGDRMAGRTTADGAGVTVSLPDGTLTASSDLTGARRALVADWVRARGAGQAARMVARDREEAARLVAMAREGLRSAGVLTGPDIAVGRSAFARGDRVVVTRPVGGWSAGMAAEILAVDWRRSAVVVRNDAGEVTDVTRAALGRFTHDYATTPHRLRGAGDVPRFVLGDISGATGKDRPPAIHRYLVLDVAAGAGSARSLGPDVAPVAGGRQGARHFDGPSPGPDLAELAARRQHVAAVMAQAPQDVTGLQRRLSERRRAADEWRVQAAARLSDALARAGVAPGRELATADPLVRTWQARAVEASQALAAIDAQGAALLQQAASRSAWLAARPELGAAERDLELATAARERVLVAAAERNPADWVNEELGPAPKDPLDRLAWRQAAQAAVSYRERHRVADRAPGLGPPPAAPHERLEYRRVRDLIRRIQPPEVRRGRSLSDRGVERRLERSAGRTGLGL
jgi:conjugative relaxase-like TrwC/TraI family protein